MASKSKTGKVQVSLLLSEESARSLKMEATKSGQTYSAFVDSLVREYRRSLRKKRRPSAV